MKTAIIIPSRYGSTRLPQKALIEIRGKTLTQHVYDRCKLAAGVDEVFVATDHPSIATVVRNFGGTPLMTSPECASGTDRVAQAALQLPNEYDVIINVQGDEPLIAPEVIGALAQLMSSDSSVAVSTPITLIQKPEDLINPNMVKVVRDTFGNAIYFSRSAIPFLRDSPLTETWIQEFAFYKHIGVYAYRRETLKRFVQLSEGSLELAERLEQLRLLEAGIPIRCVPVDYESVAVDTQADVHIIEALLDELQ